MPFNRSTNRNVFIHDARNRDEVLGGLCLPPRVPAPISHETFFRMVDILVLEGHYTLEDADGTQIQPDAQPLLPGHYYIVPDDDVAVLVNDEPVVMRTISLGTGTRVRAFSQAVRERDGGCVVTRDPVLGDDYAGYQAAHIFPLAHQQYWNQHGFSRWISLLPDKGGAINSVQNGLLMRMDLHQLFDTYAFSINPDDRYKIIWFRERAVYGHAEGTLPRQTLDDPRRPTDELLRWHFRQAVLANMRGAAEPTFEHDFPPGSDMLEDIRAGPKAAERMEAELFGRLALQRDLDDLGSGDDKDSLP